MHSISVITAPNAAIPGCIVVARAVYREGKTPELRAVEIRQAEWSHAPGHGCLSRVTDALTALSHHAGPSNADPRGGDPSVRLVIADNYWSSVRPRCERLHIVPDGIVTIRPGMAAPDGHHHRRTVGRLFLLDALRDRLPLVSVSLPGERTDELPDIVTGHELRSALRTVQARPRLLDEETLSPGLDREDVLVLAVALAVDDLARALTSDPRGVNPHVGQARRPRRAAISIGPREPAHRINHR
jgi:hypothetical protein